MRVSQAQNLIGRDFVKNVLKVEDEAISKMKLECDILGVPRSIRFVVRELEDANIILGLTALKGFLVDPFKYKK